MLIEKVHIAVPTAFYKDESLNVQGTFDHIRELQNQGVKSVLISGTTGEQHSLSLQEKIELIDKLELEEALLDSMEVIFGVSSVRQKEAEELAERIKSTKLSAIMLGYPPYIIPTQEEAISYTKRIVQLSNKPTILYNNPNRTGFDLSEESIIHLSELNLIVGLKEAGEKEKVKNLKNSIKRSDFYFYAGGEIDLEAKLLCGYNRLSSMAGNVNPREINYWFNQLLTEQAINDQTSEKINSIMKQVYEGNPIVNLKEIINRDNKLMGNCRSPIGSVIK